jgi:proteasome lid subunit RPN8/RPN11
MAGKPQVELSEYVRGSIKKRALSLPQEEICGIVLHGIDYTIDNIVPILQKGRRFRMEPKRQMEIWNLWRRDGDIVVYHSHPTGRSEPSQQDKWVISRSPDVIFVIYSIKEDKFQAYRHSDDACGIIELEIIQP